MSESSERLPPEVRQMLSSMEQDVSFAIQTDALLIELAQVLFEKYKDDPSKQDFIRQNLRDMGRLRLALHKKSLLGFADALRVHSFFRVVDAVKSMAGFDENKQSFEKPSLALNLGNLLKRIAILVITSRDSEKSLVRHAKLFIKRFATDWFELVSQPAIISLTGRKTNSPSTIPFTRDAQAFYLYLEKTYASAIESMETSKCPKAYSTLCRVTLAQASILSKCTTEISEMTVKAFQERDSDTQVLSKHFTRVNIQNKTGQTVAVLLTSDLFRALTLLVEKRQSCGVHDANPFLFARPDCSSTSLYHAESCIRDFSSLCGAKNPQHLRSKFLYKHMARIFQILNLENDELEHLGKLLGHDIRTEQDYYRSPEAVVELAKIAKLIQAMEKGSLEGFKGNSLEEVEIEDELEPDVEQKTGDAGAEANIVTPDPLCLQRRTLEADVEQRDVSQGSSDKPSTSEKETNDTAASSQDVRVEDLANVNSPAEPFSDHEYIISDEELDESFSTLGDVSSVQQDAPHSSDDSDSDEGPKKTSGPRKSKRYYCYVCGRPQSKSSRHLFTHRNERPEIAEAFAQRKNSKARKILLAKLRKRGNDQHKEKVGQLLIQHRGANKSKEQAACIYCKAMYDHKDIWQHIQNCHKKTSSAPAKSQIVTLAADTGLPDPQHIPEDLKKMLKRLKKDEVGAVAQKDPYILQLAQYLYHTMDLKNGPASFNQKVRLMARLLLTLKKRSIQSFEEAVKPHNMDTVVEAVDEIAAQRKKATSSSRALISFKLGSLIRKIADIRYAKVVREEAAKETMQEAETFLKLCAKQWPAPPTKLRTVGAATVPFVHDVQSFYKCLVDTTASGIQSLTLYQFPQVYTALLKATLAHAAILNRKAEDISEITLASFKDTKETEFQEETAGCQSHLEHILSMHRVKINVKTNNDKEITLTLTDQLLSAFTLLMNKREACGVHESNPYLFGQPEAGPAEFHQAHSCIRFQLRRCDRKCHERLASARYCEHIVRIFEILSLTNDGLDQLAKLLGREIRTDSEFYQTPEAATDVAKLTELVLAMKNGSLGKFEGKSFEEIEIPDKLYPILEVDMSLKTGSEENSEGSEKPLQQSKTKTRRKRQCSSPKRNNSDTRTKKTKEETQGTDVLSEEDDQSAEKEVNSEKVSEKTDIDAPEEEVVPRSKRTETRIYFSDDDDEMNVDFDVDLDTDDDVRHDESRDSPATPEETDGEEDGSGTKKGDNATDDFTENHTEGEDDCVDPNWKTKTTRKGQHSSPKRKNSHTMTKKRKEETQRTDVLSEEDDQSAEKEVNSEKVSDKIDIDAPEEEEVPRSKKTETHIYFSDDDGDMNVDFDVDLDTDDDVRHDEPDEARDSPAMSEEADGEEDSSGAKKGDNAANAEEQDSVEEADEDDDCMDANCGNSSASLTPEKKNLAEVLKAMKQVKIVIPKLDISKLSNQLCGSGENDKNQTEKPSTLTAVADSPSYAKAVHMNCSCCKKSMKKGQTAFQKKGFSDVFCSKNCLFEMFPCNKQPSRKCHNCQKAITQPLDLIMAAVDTKGSMKDFCSTACLCSFKSNVVSIPTPPSLCSLCKKSSATNCELTLEGTVHKFCGDACLEDFCWENLGDCEKCRSTCRSKPLMLKFQGGTKTICSDKCLKEFAEGAIAQQQCTMCSVSQPVSKMVTSKTSGNLVELFCNRYCVVSYSLRPTSLNSPEGNTVQTRRRKEPGRQTKRKQSENTKPDATDASVPPLSSVVSVIMSRSCMDCCKCGKKLLEGETLYQPKNLEEVFCSVSCLSKKHPSMMLYLKTCYNCLQVITRPHNIILAPVDNSGTKKELCSNTCLISAQKRMNFTSVTQPHQLHYSCGMCFKRTHCKFTLTLNDKRHRLCSESCFVSFHKLNNLPETLCDVCASVCQDRKLLLTVENESKTICSDDCLFKFKEKVEAPQLCHMCQTPHQMSDMVELQNDEDGLEFFCSSRCSMMYSSLSSAIPEDLSCDENEVKDIKPLLSLDCVKEEPIDEECNQNPPASVSTLGIKNELCLKEVKISPDLTSAEASSPAEPTPTTSSDSCSACKKILMDGDTIYQKKGLPDTFCSTACLSSFQQMKQRKQACCFCFQPIAQSGDICLRAVDEDGTEKEFCSQACLSSFNHKKTGSSKILTEPLVSQSQCSMCCKYCISKREIMLKNIVYKVCSDPCYLRFCTLNNMSICEVCLRCCDAPLLLKTENSQTALCSADCVSQFKQKIETPQPCALCQTSVPISEMYENKTSDNVIELFCTKGCVTASKIQAVSASGAAFDCDKCGRTAVPACHLAMPDTTIRNFCSLACAVAFKKAQKNIAAGADSTGAPNQTQSDSHKSPQKLLCPQCQRVLKSIPKVIYMKDKLLFVCSTACSQDFQRVNIIRGTCGNCKNERSISGMKKVDGRLVSFCSDGCETLSLLELEKTCGQRLGSCSCCLARFRSAKGAGKGKEFCSQECCSKYKTLLSNMAKCDSCGHQGKLKQSLALFGEVKHFCDLKCLLHFCSKVAQKDIAELFPLQSPNTTKTSPVITSVVSLAEALMRRAKTSVASAQHDSRGTSPVITSDIPASAQNGKHSGKAKVVGHAGTQTKQKEMKNKSMLCTPLIHNKGVSCTAQTVETEVQTDKVDPSVVILPVPVYVPLPMNMYSQYTPTAVALPVPLPVPVLLPMTAAGSEPTPKETSESISGDQDLSPETEAGENDRNQTEEEEEEEPRAQQGRKEGEGTPQPVFKMDFPCCSVPERLTSNTPEEREGRQRSESPPPVLPHNGHLKEGSEPQQSPETLSDEACLRDKSTKAHKLQTQWGVDVWKSWVQWRQSQTNPGPISSAVMLKEEVLHCSAEELSEGLCCFINEVKQASGEPQTPDKLFYFCLCIQQYLFENDRTENIFSDLIYSRFSSEFTKVMKSFKPSPTGSGPVSCVEEEFLWECKQLGAYSPIVLLNTLLFFSCKYLGFTSVEQHRRLSFTYIRSSNRTKGNVKTASLRFYTPKIRAQAEPDTDGVPAKKRKKNEEKGDFVEMIENSENPLRCPVRLYKFYLCKCPQSVRERSNLFHLCPDYSCVPSSPLWFSPTPLDDATMEAMLARILAVREILQKD
ncbi:uncharacterized protein LOC115409280 isoform X2 [Salarias fasciatus]|uniref:uncharacterized protein LOC115409280 isoform X2 n=1 Tax=Salarias fasciatus TaxID=181472 RepID=UPI0011766597|nr:uncharacterized protein LOC115409280 isoform X2 [Salarias fasciatus]